MVVSDGYDMRDFTIPKKQNRELRNVVFASSRLYHLPCYFRTTTLIYYAHVRLYYALSTLLYSSTLRM